MPAKKETLLHRLFTLTEAVVLGVFTLWLAGFIAFYASVVTATPKNPDEATDVVIVLTGGTGRIEEGFKLMTERRAKAMLVTGVHPAVTLKNIVDRWNGPAEEKTALLNHCCIFIGHEAFSTEENASETRGWLDRNGGPQGVTLRLVTSDYHMPRAKLLFKRTLPEVALYPWPVESRNAWRSVLSEYTKTLLTWIS